MVLTAVPRALLRPLAQTQSIGARLTSCSARSFTGGASINISRPSPVVKNRSLALTAYKQHTALIRRQSTVVHHGTMPETKKELEQHRKEMLPRDIEHVTMDSSVHPVLGEIGDPEVENEDDADMMAGMKHDYRAIREAMSFEAVPREAYVIGMAGILPYVATATATLFSAFEFNTAVHNGGQGWMISQTTAETALHILEPLQVGYGAVIISFLGAIHWGLEWAGYGGHIGYRRYAIGVIAPAVAWPTTLMPVEYALITQFLTFNFLYAEDSQCAKRGWVPPWYGTYRFVLTFIVGGSIVISLIGRGQVMDLIDRQPSAMERVKKMTAAGRGE